MAFDIDEDIDSVAESSNQYLSNAERGLDLVAELLSGSSSIADRRIYRILDSLIASCDRLVLPEGEKRFAELRQLVDLLNTSVLDRTLRGCSIVGFGGSFSAGKSSVLNSLMESGATFTLPENLSATTSISTYIMHGQKSKVMACTRKGREISLDADALNALSHEFQTVYNLNVSQYIDFISIVLPQFSPKNIALLDTPGYNASDGGTQQEHTDRARSLSALRSVDHLMWIISAEEPLLSKTDSTFIKKLNVPGTITVILNKCDLNSNIYYSKNPELTNEIKKIKEGFKEAGIKYSKIIPYTAKESDWKNGRQEILSTLKKISGERFRENRITQLNNIISSINKEFNNTLSQMSNNNKLKEIDNSIDSSPNPLALQALVRLRGIMGYEYANIQQDANNFKELSSKILSWAEKKQSTSL